MQTKIRKMQEYYALAEEYINSERLKDAATNIRHILEIVLNFYVEESVPEAIFYKTFDKINILGEKEILNERELDTLHQIRVIVNKGAHEKSGEELNKEEVIQARNAIKPFIYNIQKIGSNNSEETVCTSYEELLKKDILTLEKLECIRWKMHFNVFNFITYQTYLSERIGEYVPTYRIEKDRLLKEEYKRKNNLWEITTVFKYFNCVFHEEMRIDLKMKKVVYYSLCSNGTIYYVINEEENTEEGVWANPNNNIKEQLKEIFYQLAKEQGKDKDLPDIYKEKKANEKAESQAYELYRLLELQNSCQVGCWNKYNLYWYIDENKIIKWLYRNGKCIYVHPLITNEERNEIMDIYVLWAIAHELEKYVSYEKKYDFATYFDNKRKIQYDGEIISTSVGHSLRLSLDKGNKKIILGDEEKKKELLIKIDERKKTILDGSKNVSARSIFVDLDEVMTFLLLNNFISEDRYLNFEKNTYNCNEHIANIFVTKKEENCINQNLNSMNEEKCIVQNINSNTKSSVRIILMRIIIVLGILSVITPLAKSIFFVVACIVCNFIAMFLLDKKEKDRVLLVGCVFIIIFYIRCFISQ